jgi:hypothetical protein
MQYVYAGKAKLPQDIEHWEEFLESFHGNLPSFTSKDHPAWLKALLFEVKVSRKVSSCKNLDITATVFIRHTLIIITIISWKIAAFSGREFAAFEERLHNLQFFLQNCFANFESLESDLGIWYLNETESKQKKFCS